MTSTVSAPETQATESKPFWEDVIDIFYTPSSVFARRSDGRYAVAALVLTLVFVAMAFSARTVLAPVFDAEIMRAVAKLQEQNVELSAEQLAGMRKANEIGVIIGALFFIPITAIAVGALTRLFGAIFGATLTFKLSVLIVVYAQFPRALQQILSIVQGLVMSPDSMTSRFAISFSPARFLDVNATSPLVLALVERLDIFTLWATVLIAIGYQVLGKLPRGQAYLAAVLVWLTATIPVLLGGVFGAG